MIIFETISKAKCKHCLLCENNKQVGFTKKRQAYCNYKQEYIRLNDLVCNQFELVKGIKTLE